MLLELAADAQIAEARGTRVHARFDEARLRQVLVLLQPGEQGFDSLRRTCGLGGSVGAIEDGRDGHLLRAAFSHRVGHQFAPKLDAALFALRKQLQRSGLE